MRNKKNRMLLSFLIILFFLSFVSVNASCVFLAHRDVEGLYFSKNENSKFIRPVMILSEGNGYSVQVFNYLWKMDSFGLGKIDLSKTFQFVDVNDRDEDLKFRSFQIDPAKATVWIEYDEEKIEFIRTKDPILLGVLSQIKKGINFTIPVHPKMKTYLRDELSFEALC
ncbi:hypothetical protein [Leptospira noguchii]|uniref:Uncharacterized protein n=1 Tax=Leptospira noguchii serovar Panama str. CZ214 TaxID=1001595 RepID=T0FMI5_9LEPT|nr:hypothetical protein [Leptospira noguchii]EQA70730.1 hypothetical protein LEP1GSC059_3570 [Leptospira noguchii serovar Panama str. CZ214]